MSLHRLLQESREEIDDLKRSLDKCHEENLILQRKIDDLALQNVMYFTDFYKFRAKYDEIVQIMREKVSDIKESLFNTNFQKHIAIEDINKLLDMIKLVQTNEHDARNTVIEMLFPQ